ncbi:ATP synthase subunit d, mitochondrial-like, partial [Oncorhynchus nerka]|uniref:ATP synthase subunit d, mitochondrial-like n=1 Tax=Oncorhynchus nerka TaxID=8023 RepID=UPI0031B86150
WSVLFLVLISPLSSSHPCPHLTPVLISPLSSSHPCPHLLSSSPHPSPHLLSSSPHPSPHLTPVSLTSPLSYPPQFSALTIPEPKDTATAAINTQEAEANKAAVAYVEASKARIGQYEKELEKFQNMIPFDQMTIDDLNDTFPETKLDKEKHPYWPHKPIAEL